jgi:hypothetical protein
MDGCRNNTGYGPSFLCTYILRFRLTRGVVVAKAFEYVQNGEDRLNGYEMQFMAVVPRRDGVGNFRPVECPCTQLPYNEEEIRASRVGVANSSPGASGQQMMGKTVNHKRVRMHEHIEQTPPPAAPSLGL